MGKAGRRTTAAVPAALWLPAGDARGRSRKLPVAQRRRWGSMNVLFGRMSRAAFLSADWDETISVPSGTGGEVKH